MQQHVKQRYLASACISEQDIQLLTEKMPEVLQSSALASLCKLTAAARATASSKAEKSEPDTLAVHALQVQLHIEGLLFSRFKGSVSYPLKLIMNKSKD